MTKFTKFAVGTLAALTLTAGVLGTSTQAQAGWKGGWGWGPAVGFGIAAGALAGAAYAASGPGYYVAAPVGCRWVARYDSWGNYRGSRKVCDVY